ncbi:hypothetical protein D0869_13054 [Hortaea werneckii]|uniref:BHLH domain-containing protein n=1 Tax=Hortaea werneckii TaxID=91943 RepID=A0A3M6XPB1_HORWE|nr:hypothetical protein D0869_13054 [Hortaea werneckii]RMX92609.1 hypothetical protein D0868_13318 [Hortaea werneckii]
MSDQGEADWRSSYYNHLPTLTSQWADHGAQMGSIQAVDLRMFHHEGPHPTSPYHQNPGQITSPAASYHHGDGTHWMSDVEMGTPSTVAYGTEPTEGYFSGPRVSETCHLQLPNGNITDPASAGTPGCGSHERMIYNGHAGQAEQKQRPNISRSVTAPEPRQRRLTASTSEAAVLKRNGISDDGDEEYMPVGEEPKNRGRKRQRIPHTAVERRYRENLNAHLDKLRQTVPALAARNGKGCEGMQEGVKPSKCEILNGAIEHICALDKENQALKNELKLLKARLENTDRWYRGHTRGGFGA